MSPKQTREAPCTKAAELDMLSDLMAPIEDCTEEEEEEIEEQEEEADP